MKITVHRLINADEEYDACREIIIREARAAKLGALIQYAASYCVPVVTQEERAVQCLYILNNLSGWRGPLARSTKERLRILSQL